MEKESIVDKTKIAIKWRKLFRQHFEWIAFTAAIAAMALMNPYVDSGLSWCFFERLGLPCPGDGLGHSIAFIFRGDFTNAIQANVLGPVVLIVLSGRILYLVKENVFNKNKNTVYYG